MKIAIYDSLDKIPEADRNDYKLVTETGSPNFNKYVLDLDPNHPVALKNNELLQEKTQKETAHQTALTQKETEIAQLKTEVATAQSKSLPAGHVAIPVTEAQLLNEVKTLGDIKTVKEKLDEHTILKANEEANTQRERLSEVAKRNGIEPEAFIPLAMTEKLLDLLDEREIDDGKGNKVKHDFVKTKDAAGAEKPVVLTEFVKENATFKPFLGSLFATGDKNRVKIPPTKVGDPPQEKSAGRAYVNRAYKRPDEKPQQ